MKYHQLGRTDLHVTQLGYDSMGLRGPRTWGIREVTDDHAERMLHAVLDAGINFIDTAPDYGVSEERIGRFLSGRRKEFLLATKCGCDPQQHADHLEIRHVWTKDVVQRNVEHSLQRMKTDVIDLLQFHGGDAATLQQAGLIDHLLNLKQQGVIRHLGISSSLPHLPALIQLNVFETLQIPYSCLAPQHDHWIQQAADARAGIIIRGGIAQGGPDAEIQRPALNDVWAQARLDELLTGDMTRAELILRSTLSLPQCHTTIIGTCHLEHLAENVAAANKGLLPDELQKEIAVRVAAVLPP